MSEFHMESTKQLQLSNAHGTHLLGASHCLATAVLAVLLQVPLTSVAMATVRPFKHATLAEAEADPVCRSVLNYFCTQILVSSTV
jgi:hypothetical protein